MWRLAELFLVAAVFPVLVAHLFVFAASLDARSLPPTILGVLAGVLVLDGMTGVVHWACDTWGDERTRWVGPGLVRSFREHHRDPRAILVHGWVEVNRETTVATLLILLVLGAPPLHSWLLGRPFAAGVVYALFGLGCISNQYHCWAHTEHPPAGVQWLQARGLILSPERHERHHRAPRVSAYCIATGWLNPLLDRVGAWRHLENCVTRLTGVRPRAEVQDGPTTTR